jgi:hypothetical protein
MYNEAVYIKVYSDQDLQSYEDDWAVEGCPVCLSRTPPLWHKKSIKCRECSYMEVFEKEL